MVETRPKILVVDDEKANLELMEAYLSLDYDLIFARSGTDAFEKVHEDPDLILLDVLMPEMNGFEVCKQFKRSEKTKLIPIVLVTALEKHENLQKGIEAGADEFLTKPVDMFELKIRVKSLLRIKRQQDIIIEEGKTTKKYLTHLNQLLETSPIAILSLDLEQNITLINRSALRLLDYEEYELINHPLSQIMEQGERIKFEDRIHFPVNFLKKSGSPISMNVSTSVIEENHMETGLIVTLQDISALRGLFITPHKETLSTGSGKKLLELPNGFIFAMDNGDFNSGYELFANHVKSGFEGLCITRINPSKIREEYSLEFTPLVWLTQNKIPNVPTIDPNEIFKLHPTINNFISKAEKGIVFIDGLEYLILENDVKSVIKLMEQINDTVMASSSKLIVQVDPEAFDRKEYHLFKRWMKKVPHEHSSIES
ncbi:PAS domain S-box-containing protein [Methanohalophilus levihalophilus]|uniref:DUF835 domain-containing protein n=1 Tax=Methanohalophilus levihalophilus TaxID=1431282 RepID=UPI001AEA3675|nr:DUF835 domain-containing protein [Methanohalophilus levihalophilus]MBP2029587.1 PAS domain S-box-containing protein [Methanohalophilus levihalophilus]